MGSLQISGLPYFSGLTILWNPSVFVSYDSTFLGFVLVGTSDLLCLLLVPPVMSIDNGEHSLYCDMNQR